MDDGWHWLWKEMFDANLMKLAKKSLNNLIRQGEDDARYYDRKARQARAASAFLRELRPLLVKMLKPPTPLKPPSKRELAKLRKMGGIFPTASLEQ